MNYLESAAIIFTLLAALSFYKIRTGKGKSSYIYRIGFSIGSFVWEDLFVFSIYFFILSIISLKLEQIKFFILGFTIFWLVRSLGEMFYWFLQQFIEPKHYPHNVTVHLENMHIFFGKISEQQGMILFQVFMQMITMLSILALIFILRNWSILP